MTLKPRRISCSSTDRYVTRKFNMLYGDALEKVVDEISEDEELMNIVRKCADINARNGKEAQFKMDRYTHESMRDMYSVPTLLGLNTFLTAQKKEWIAVYDLMPLHFIALASLLGIPREECKKRVMRELKKHKVSFKQYLYWLEGYSDPPEGFNVSKLLLNISTSYINLELKAKEANVSVAKYVHLYLSKFNENLFEEFVHDGPNNWREIIIQSVSMNILTVAGSKVHKFEPIVLNMGRHKVEIEPEIYKIGSFNKEISKSFLKRGEMYDKCI